MMQEVLEKYQANLKCFKKYFKNTKLEPREISIIAAVEACECATLILIENMCGADQAYRLQTLIDRQFIETKCIEGRYFYYLTQHAIFYIENSPYNLATVI